MFAASNEINSINIYIMATKKAKKVKATIIEKAANRVLGVATMANEFALAKTEKAVLTSFDVAGKCVDFSGKVMKKGLQISASQQEMVFDVLGGLKKKVVKK